MNKSIKHIAIASIFATGIALTACGKQEQPAQEQTTPDKTTETNAQVAETITGTPKSKDHEITVTEASATEVVENNNETTEKQAVTEEKTVANTDEATPEEIAAMEEALSLADEAQ